MTTDAHSDISPYTHMCVHLTASRSQPPPSPPAYRWSKILPRTCLGREHCCPGCCRESRSTETAWPAQWMSEEVGRILLIPLSDGQSGQACVITNTRVKTNNKHHAMKQLTPNSDTEISIAIKPNGNSHMDCNVITTKQRRKLCHIKK